MASDDEGLEALVAALHTFFADQPDVVAAYLFGSMVSGRARPGSDVDVAVLLSAELDGETRFWRRLGLMGEVEDACGREADVVVLNDAPPILQHQVLRYGRLVYERDRAARVAFEVEAGKVYADFEHSREFFRQALFREVKEVGLGGR